MSGDSYEHKKPSEGNHHFPHVVKLSGRSGNTAPSTLELQTNHSKDFTVPGGGPY